MRLKSSYSVRSQTGEHIRSSPHPFSAPSLTRTADYTKGRTSVNIASTHDKQSPPDPSAKGRCGEGRCDRLHDLLAFVRILARGSCVHSLHCPIIPDSIEIAAGVGLSPVTKYRPSSTRHRDHHLFIARAFHLHPPGVVSNLAVSHIRVPLFCSSGPFQIFRA